MAEDFARRSKILVRLLDPDDEPTALTAFKMLRHEAATSEVHFTKWRLYSEDTAKATDNSLEEAIQRMEEIVDRFIEGVATTHIKAATVLDAITELKERIIDHAYERAKLYNIAQKIWKEKFDDIKKQYDKAVLDQRGLQADVTLWRVKYNTLRMENNELKATKTNPTQIKQLETAIAELQHKNTLLENKLKTADAASKKDTPRTHVLEAEVVSLQQEIEKLKRNQAPNRLHDLHRIPVGQHYITNVTALAGWGRGGVQSEWLRTILRPVGKWHNSGTRWLRINESGMVDCQDTPPTEL